MAARRRPAGPGAVREIRQGRAKPAQAVIGRPRGGQRRAPFIERVDLLVKLISHQSGVPNAEIDRTVEIVDQKLNEKIVQGGSGAN